MRVSATALRNSEADAVGALELECTLAGLRIDLHGLAAAQNGFAPGGFISGARIVIPFSEITSALSHDDALQIEIDSPRLPFKRLVLSHFTTNEAAHPIELKKRRTILHLSALAVASMTGLGVTSVFASNPERAGLTAFIYGAALFCLILLVAYSVDQRFFLRPATPLEARMAFENELSQYFPSLRPSNKKLSSSKPPLDLPRFLEKFPRSLGALTLILSSLILTLLFSGSYMNSSASKQQALAPTVKPSEDRTQKSAPPIARASSTNALARENAKEKLKPLATSSLEEKTQGDLAQVQLPIMKEPKAEACACKRSDSKLWQAPPPKLSALLIEKKVLPRKKFLKLALELAVVNNSDTPMSKVTLHVQFYEKRGNKTRAMKERPLYFEGPLRPGRAVKWSVEARGTDYEIRLPDYGDLGNDGAEAASEADFNRLLKANHRPVRLHAARMLAFLGASGAREAALDLKDALRAAEGPYLRRVLAATDSIRLCSVEFSQKEEGGVSACVYNASDSERSKLGLLMSRLSKPLDLRQPLADPPKIIAQQRLALDGSFAAQSGQVVAITLNQELQQDLSLAARKEQIELEAGPFDLLE